MDNLAAGFAFVILTVSLYITGVNYLKVKKTTAAAKERDRDYEYCDPATLVFYSTVGLCRLFGWKPGNCYYAVYKTGGKYLGLSVKREKDIWEDTKLTMPSFRLYPASMAMVRESAIKNLPASEALAICEIINMPLKDWRVLDE